MRKSKLIGIIGIVLLLAIILVFTLDSFRTRVKVGKVIAVELEAITIQDTRHKDSIIIVGLLADFIALQKKADEFAKQGKVVRLVILAKHAAPVEEPEGVIK